MLVLVYCLFCKRLYSGVYSDIFKLNSVTTIFKSDNISDVSNYQPITIISHILTFPELLVLRCIQPIVNVTLVDFITNDNQVDIIYIDFR